MYFHLVPLQSLSGKTHGPCDAWKTRFPLKTQIFVSQDDQSDTNVFTSDKQHHRFCFSLVLTYTLLHISVC